MLGIVAARQRAFLSLSNGGFQGFAHFFRHNSSEVLGVLFDNFAGPQQEHRCSLHDTVACVARETSESPSSSFSSIARFESGSKLFSVLPVAGFTDAIGIFSPRPVVHAADQAKTHHCNVRCAFAAVKSVVQRAFRLLLLPVLCPMLPLAAELNVDHVTVAGKDLKAMMASLSAVGLKCEYGGAHSNHATEMALTSFPDGSYLELIALQPNADPKAVASHAWAKQMENNAGPCAWAVRVTGIAAEVDRLKDLGTPVSAPLRNGRKRPDGKQLEWETAQIGNEPNGAFSPFHD